MPGKRTVAQMPRSVHCPSMKWAFLMQVFPLLLLLGGCGQQNRTYDADCSTPAAGFGTPNEGIGHLRPYVSIQVSRHGALTWAGQPVTDTQLVSYARQAGELNPQPQLVLEVSFVAACHRVEQVRTIMLATPICGKFRLCSEGRNPKDWPIVGGP